jgi:hypothetical protein
MRMPRDRFTKRERAQRIYVALYTAAQKQQGLTVTELARRERISKARVRYYLRLIRRVQRKQSVKIERLGNKFYYVPPQPPPERPRQLIPQRGDAELRGYWNYASPKYSSGNLNVDCVEVVPNIPNAILAGKARIEAPVRHRLGEKVASMLHYGVWPATPESRNHFLYRRGGGEWLDL